MKRILLFSFLILYSCSPTLYRPGSYTDTKIGEDMYRVRFNGNQRTGGDYAQDMALLRSADLTISKGFEYFEIVDSDNQTITRTDLLFLPLGPMMTNSNSPKTMYTIILKDKKGESSYDANYIVSTFCRKYKPFIATNLCVQEDTGISNYTPAPDDVEYILDAYGWYEVWKTDKNGLRIKIATVKRPGDEIKN